MNEDEKIEEVDEDLDDDKSEELNQLSEQELLKMRIQSFDSILGDELLPEHEEGSVDTLQAKIKTLTMKSKNNIEKSKIKVSQILIIFIVVVGIILMIVNYKKGAIVEDNTLLYELPTMSVNVMSTEYGAPHNVKLNMSLGINSNDMKALNTDECYNIVYSTVSNMTYEDLIAENAQYLIKSEVKDAFLEDSEDNLAVKVYVSGIDEGMSRVTGYTTSTQQDVSDKKMNTILDRVSEEQVEEEEVQALEEMVKTVPVTN